MVKFMVIRALTFKIIVAGPGGVGKTTMLRRYQSGNFIPASTTVGVNFVTHSFEYNSRSVILSIWDYAGEERYKVLFPGYCSGSAGAFAVFDITRPETLDQLSEWVEIIKDKNGGIPVLLVGAKIDAVENLQMMEHAAEQAIIFTKDHDLSGYFSVSSKTGEGIIELFDALSNAIMPKIQTIV